MVDFHNFRLFVDFPTSTTPHIDNSKTKNLCRKR
jgi:hypothetical protein